MEGIKLIQHWRKEFGLFKQNTPGLVENKRIDMSLSLIGEEYEELKEAVQNKDLVEVVDAIGDLYFVVTQMAETVGIDPHDIIYEVFYSNMSKLASTEEIAIKSVQTYEAKNIKAHYIPHGDKFKIIRSEDGKLLKSLEFVEPDFTKLLHE